MVNDAGLGLGFDRDSDGRGQGQGEGDDAQACVTRLPSAASNSFIGSGLPKRYP
jgi:hypothetical protein